MMTRFDEDEVARRLRLSANHRGYVSTRDRLDALALGQHLLMQRLALLTGITSAGVILLVVLGVAALLW
jgi:hypothetical protein